MTTILLKRFGVLMFAAVAAACSSGGTTPPSSTPALGPSAATTAGGRDLITDVTNHTQVCSLVAADIGYEGKPQFAPGTSLYIDSGKTRGLNLDVDRTGYPIVKLKADVYGTPDCTGSIKMHVESVSRPVYGHWGIKGLTAQLTGSPGSYQISKADPGH